MRRLIIQQCIRSECAKMRAGEKVNVELTNTARFADWALRSASTGMAVQNMPVEA